MFYVVRSGYTVTRVGRTSDTPAGFYLVECTDADGGTETVLCEGDVPANAADNPRGPHGSSAGFVRHFAADKRQGKPPVLFSPNAASIPGEVTDMRAALECLATKSYLR